MLAHIDGAKLRPRSRPAGLCSTPRETYLFTEPRHVCLCSGWIMRDMGGSMDNALYVLAALLVASGAALLIGVPAPDRAR